MPIRLQLLLFGVLGNILVAAIFIFSFGNFFIVPSNAYRFKPDVDYNDPLNESQKLDLTRLQTGKSLWDTSGGYINVKMITNLPNTVGMYVRPIFTLHSTGTKTFTLTQQYLKLYLKSPVSFGP